MILLNSVNIALSITSWATVNICSKGGLPCRTAHVCVTERCTQRIFYWDAYAQVMHFHTYCAIWLFGAYLVAVDKLSILLLKPKYFHTSLVAPGIGNRCLWSSSLAAILPWYRGCDRLDKGSDITLRFQLHACVQLPYSQLGEGVWLWQLDSVQVTESIQIFHRRSCYERVSGWAPWSGWSYYYEAPLLFFFESKNHVQCVPCAGKEWKCASGKV